MTTFDDVANFSDTTVVTPPSPAVSGTTMLLGAGNGPMPTPPFWGVVHPSDGVASFAQAEWVRVTAMSGQQITAMARAQLGTTAKAVEAGWRFAAPLTAEQIEAIQGAIGTLESGYGDHETRIATLEAAPGGGSTVTIDADGTLNVDGQVVELATDTELAAKADIAGEVYSGTHDFSGATVVGITGGGGGQSPYVDLADYVDDLDGTGDWLSEVHAARDAALAAGKPLWCHGTVRVAGSVDFTADNLMIECTDNFTVLQATTNVPYVKIGGNRQRVRGMFTATAESTPLAGHTSAVGFELWDVFMSSYQHLRASRTNVGIKIAQANAPSESQNTNFSNVFETVEVNGWLTRALDLRSYTGNSTPVLFCNVYLHNNYSGSPATASEMAVAIGNYDNAVFLLLNIEHGIQSAWHALSLNNGSATVIALHIENYELEASETAIVNVYGRSHLRVYGLTLQGNPGGGGTPGFTSAGAQSVVRVGGGGTHPTTVDITGVEWKSSLPTPATPAQFALVRSDGSPADVTLRQVDSAVPWRTTDGGAGRLTGGGASTYVRLEQAGDDTAPATVLWDGVTGSQPTRPDFAAERIVMWLQPSQPPAGVPYALPNDLWIDTS